MPTILTVRMSPVVKQRSDSFWRAREAHWALMNQTEEDEPLSKSGRKMDRALLRLLKETPLTSTDLATQARALWWSLSWPHPHEGEIQFPSNNVTVPALFKGIERVTGIVVCDDPYAKR